MTLALTPDQYKKILTEIWDKHRFGGLSKNKEMYKCKHIKYVRPNWDMRDGMCFSIRFDGMACGKDGTEFNSLYGETVPMVDRIMEWLDSSTN